MDAVDDDEVDCTPVDAESDVWCRFAIRELWEENPLTVMEPVELDPISIKPVRNWNVK